MKCLGTFQKTADVFGKIDVLVVNAGGVVDGIPMGSISDVTEEGYDRYMDLNLKSTYFTVQKSLPYLNDGAYVILIGSSVAQTWIDIIPVGKQGLPSDIGRAAVFLASDDSAFIVGAEILCPIILQ